MKRTLASGFFAGIAAQACAPRSPLRPSISVSKAAIVYLTRITATEWARKGVRANCGAPVYVDAPMALEIFVDDRVDRKLIKRRMPVGRLGQPDEIANAVASLTSGAASFITRVTLPVDAGWGA